MHLAISSRKGLAAAAMLLATLTAHAQWELEDSHTTADLRGIHTLGAGIAWASGTHGTVLRTEDGGTHWQGCATPPGAENLDFRGVQAFDEDTAIVMSSGPGDQSRLYKTTDGCRTWKLLFTNPDKDGFWDALHFYNGKTFDPARLTSGIRLVRVRNRTTGMLVGDPVKGAFAIFTTQDGGSSWRRWGTDKGTRSAKARRGESLFAASNSSLVSPGINGRYCFVTGGAGGSRLLFEQGHNPFDTSTWFAFSSVVLPMPAAASGGAFSVARREDVDGRSGHFVIVGGDDAKPESGSAAFVYQPFFLSHAAARPAQTSPHGYRSSVAYDPTHKTWITVGPNGTDISKDDGRNWTALKPSNNEPADADQHWNALSLPFVVGPHGRIGKLRPSSLGPDATTPQPITVKP